jgi:NADH:ubiquinone oxidoreductase subunit K
VDLLMYPWLNPVNTLLTIVLFLVGLICLLISRNLIKQVIGLKIMLQGATMGLLHAGKLSGDLAFAQTMVISALIVETAVFAIALALIINAFRHYASGDVRSLNRLKG